MEITRMEHDKTEQYIRSLESSAAIFKDLNDLEEAEAFKAGIAAIKAQKAKVNPKITNATDAIRAMENVRSYMRSRTCSTWKDTETEQNINRVIGNIK